MFCRRFETQDRGKHCLSRRRHKPLSRATREHEELLVRTMLFRQSAPNVFAIVRLILGTVFYRRFHVGALESESILK